MGNNKSEGKSEAGGKNRKMTAHYSTYKFSFSSPLRITNFEHASLTFDFSTTRMGCEICGSLFGTFIVSAQMQDEVLMTIVS